MNRKLAICLTAISALTLGAVAYAGVPGSMLNRLVLSVITPYMNMNLPNPSSTIGPQWATQLNTALGVVDAHNHTPGNGVQVPTAGLNINSDLNIKGNALFDAGSVMLADQGSSLPSTRRELVYGAAGNLWFNDGSGNAIQITGSGGVLSGSTCGGPGGCTIITPTTFQTSGGTTECTIDNSGNISCNGSGTFGNGLSVTAGGATIVGPTNAAGITASGNVAANTLTIGGAAQLDGGINCVLHVVSSGSNVFTMDCSGNGTMTGGLTLGGQLNMGNNRITNLGSAVLGTDAVTLGQLLDGGGAFVGSQNSCAFNVLYPDAGGVGQLFFVDCSGNTNVEGALIVANGASITGNSLETGNFQITGTLIVNSQSSFNGQIAANGNPGIQGNNIRVPDGFTAGVYGRVMNESTFDHEVFITENGFPDAGGSNIWCEDDNTAPALIQAVKSSSGWTFEHLPAGACSNSLNQDANLSTLGTLTLPNQLLSDGGVVVNGSVIASTLNISGAANVGSLSFDGGVLLRLGNLAFGGYANQGLFWDAGAYPDGGGVLSVVDDGFGDLQMQAAGFVWTPAPTTSCTYLGVTSSANADFYMDDSSVFMQSHDGSGLQSFGGQTLIYDGFGFAYTGTCGLHYAPDTITLGDGGIAVSVPITSPGAINTNQLATLGQVNAAVTGAFTGPVVVSALTVDAGNIVFIGSNQQIAWDAGANPVYIAYPGPNSPALTIEAPTSELRDFRLIHGQCHRGQRQHRGLSIRRGWRYGPTPRRCVHGQQAHCSQCCGICSSTRSIGPDLHSGPVLYVSGGRIPGSTLVCAAGRACRLLRLLHQRQRLRVGIWGCRQWGSTT